MFLAAELEQRIEEKVRETLTERILREANLDGQVKAAIDKIEKPTTAVGLRAAAHSRSPPAAIRLELPGRPLAVLDEQRGD